MQIIGVTGRKGHGKSHFCKFLGERLTGHVEYINFKTPLLEMARSIGWDGKKDKRGRRLLQRLGTDVVRECIDEDYWVMKWKHSVDRTMHWGHDCKILVDDVRFNNEAAGIKVFGGLIVKVVTPDQDIKYDEHISEAGIMESYIDKRYDLRFGLDYIRSAVEDFHVSYKL
jgi:hypothetical protein